MDQQLPVTTKHTYMYKSSLYPVCTTAATFKAVVDPGMHISFHLPGITACRFSVFC